MPVIARRFVADDLILDESRRILGRESGHWNITFGRKGREAGGHTLIQWLD